MLWDGLLLDCRLATMAANGAAFGLIDDGALGWKDGRVVFASPMSALPGQPVPPQPGGGEQVADVRPVGDRVLVATTTGRVVSLDLADGKPHTYRIQGPSFVVEFLNVQADSAGNKANHIHSSWRHPSGDFGLTAK